MTVIILVNALIIVTAISTISILERKINSRTKNSTPAFQAADSGVEWILFEVEAADTTDTLEVVFGTGEMDAQGRLQCPGSLGVDCEFYFVDELGVIITNDATTLADVEAVRVVGKFGEQEEQASRAIEAVLAIATCPSGFLPISDYCIMENDLDTDGTWETAAQECVENYDSRLCTAAEWIVACELSEPGEPLDGQISEMTDGNEWTGDLVDTGDVLVIGNGNCTNTSGVSSSDTNQRRCCSNLQ